MNTVNEQKWHITKQTHVFHIQNNHCQGQHAPPIDEADGHTAVIICAQIQ